MSTRYILASLSYFSIFFAGVILPLIILLVTNDDYVRKHAGRALISHILPYFFLVVGLFSLFAVHPFFSIGIILLLGAIALILVVWNVYMGIRVLREGRIF